jgi:PKD repeat protein
MAATQRVVTFGPPITASFGWSSNGLTVTFLGSATGGTGVATYAWDFGDNQTSTQQNPVHTYAAQGTYTVQLVVTDQQSLCQDAETQDVTP